MSALISANPASSLCLPPEFVYKRTTPLKVVGKEGRLVDIPANIPPFEWDYVTGECLGVAMAQQNTNFVPYSENFSHTSWLKTGVSLSSDADESPEGISGVTALTGTATSSSISVNVTTPAQGSQSVCSFSIFVKKTSARYIRIFGSITNPLPFEVAPDVHFDLDTGTVSRSNVIFTEITKLANGWWRLSVGSYLRIPEDPAPASFTQMLISIYGTNTKNGAAEVGDWFKVWGAQYNRGSAVAGWYIKTNGSAVASSPASLYLKLDGQISQSSYTALIDFISSKPTANNGFLFCINSATPETNYLGVGYQSGYSVSNTAYHINSLGDGTTLSVLNTASYQQRQKQRVGITWSAGNKVLAALAGSGTYASTNVVNGAFPAFVSLSIAGRMNLSESLAFTTNGWFRELRLYKDVVSLNELRAIANNNR